MKRIEAFLIRYNAGWHDRVVRENPLIVDRIAQLYHEHQMLSIRFAFLPDCVLAFLRDATWIFQDLSKVDQQLLTLQNEIDTYFLNTL